MVQLFQTLNAQLCGSGHERGEWGNINEREEETLKGMKKVGKETKKMKEEEGNEEKERKEVKE
jgi:hypothetical protein